MSEQLLHQILQKLDHIESEQASMRLDIQGVKSEMAGYEVGHTRHEVGHL